MPSHSFTRTELHQLIWSKPLNKLAAELGLSDVGLKKLCKRHDIPTPPQGHWISIHHGKSRPTIPLPPKPEDNDPQFRIGFAATLTPKAARADIQALKTDARAKRETAPLLPTRPTSELHPALAATAIKLRTATPDRDGAITARGESLCGLWIGIEHRERIIAFLDALFRDLTARNIDISSNGTRMIARRGPDDIEFRIAGKTEERIYRPTEAERAADKERERRFALGFSRDEKRAYPDTHVVFNGRYALYVETWTPGVRKTWSDSKRQSLEAMLHEVAAGLDACLLAHKALREEREARWRRQEEAAAREARAQARQARDAKRAQFLSALIAGEDEARRLEAWLARAPAAYAAPQPWPNLIAWAHKRLAALHAQADPDTVIALLSDSHPDLFPDPDPLAEPAGAERFDDNDDHHDEEDDDFDE